MTEVLPQLLERMLPLLAAIALVTVAIRLLLMLAAPKLFARNAPVKQDPVLEALGGSAISVAPCPIWTRGEGRLLSEVRGVLASPPLAPAGLTAHARVALGEVMTVRGSERMRDIATEALDVAWLAVLIAGPDGTPRLAVAYRDDQAPRRAGLGGGAYEDSVRRQACARAGLPLIEIAADEPIGRTLDRVRAALMREVQGPRGEVRALRASGGSRGGPQAG